MEDKKKSYKEIHGTTRVGDFLRSLKKSNVSNVIGELLKGDVAGAIQAVLATDELSDEEKQQALKLIELDIAEMNGISTRWNADMASDSWLSKNVRPLSLVFLTFTTVLLIYLDAFTIDVEVPTEWIDLLKSLLLGVYVAYFGSRGVEKFRAIGNNK